jgi:two-component system, chemotaxis family, chemotaxis protein CheY
VKRALIVDDSPYNRSVLSAILKRMNLAVDLAEDGEEGVQKFLATKPDVVFLDYVMPKMNGLQVLQEIRKANPDVLLIMVTSISASDDVTQAKAAGANAYILKPYAPEKIRDILKKFKLI